MNKREMGSLIPLDFKHSFSRMIALMFIITNLDRNVQTLGTMVAEPNFLKIEFNFHVTLLVQNNERYYLEKQHDVRPEHLH
jgi:hypothetical protein